MEDDVRVSFRFIGANVDPALVTSRTGIIADSAHRKGETVQKYPERKYPTGVWGIGSRLPGEEALEAHLSHLLDRLEPHAMAITGLVSAGYRGDFFCSYFMERDTGRLELTAAVLSRMGALGLSLIIDLHHWGNEESEE